MTIYRSQSTTCLQIPTLRVFFVTIKALTYSKTVQVCELIYILPRCLARMMPLGYDTVFALLSFPAVQLSPATQRGRLGHAVRAVLVQELLAGHVPQAGGLGNRLPEEIAVVVGLRRGGAGGAPVVFGEVGPPPLAQVVLQGEIRHRPGTVAVGIPAGTLLHRLPAAPLVHELVVVFPGSQRGSLLQPAALLAGEVQGVIRPGTPRPPGPVRAVMPVIVPEVSSPARALAHGGMPRALLHPQLAHGHPTAVVEALVHPPVRRPLAVPEGAGEVVQVRLHVLVLLHRQQAADRLGASKLHGGVQRPHVAHLLRDVHARVFAQVRHREPGKVLLALGSTICGEAFAGKGERKEKKRVKKGTFCRQRCREKAGLGPRLLR